MQSSAGACGGDSSSHMCQWNNFLLSVGLDDDDAACVWWDVMISDWSSASHTLHLTWDAALSLVHTLISHEMLSSDWSTHSTAPPLIWCWGCSLQILVSHWSTSHQSTAASDTDHCLQSFDEIRRRLSLLFYHITRSWITCVYNTCVVIQSHSYQNREHYQQLCTTCAGYSDTADTLLHNKKIINFFIPLHQDTRFMQEHAHSPDLMTDGWKNFTRFSFVGSWGLRRGDVFQIEISLPESCVLHWHWSTTTTHLIWTIWNNISDDNPINSVFAAHWQLHLTS